MAYGTDMCDGTVQFGGRWTPWQALFHACLCLWFPPPPPSQVADRQAAGHQAGQFNTSSAEETAPTTPTACHQCVVWFMFLCFLKLLFPKFFLHTYSSFFRDMRPWERVKNFWQHERQDRDRDRHVPVPFLCGFQT